jgi:hypothetical protein
MGSLVSLLCALLEILGALMVACSIKPTFEAGIATPVFGWGRNAVPVRFNRGLFRVGVLLIVAAGIAGRVLR